MLVQVSTACFYRVFDNSLATHCTEFRTRKPSDVISTLVSIYDSKDLFVKELQVLLAQKLLQITDGNFDKEVKDFHYYSIRKLIMPCLKRRNIEILKIRFGEAALQVCEVMLRDMTESRRTDQHIKSQAPVSSLLLSFQSLSKSNSR